MTITASTGELLLPTHYTVKIILTTHVENVQLIVTNLFLFNLFNSVHTSVHSVNVQSAGFCLIRAVFYC